MKVSNILYLLHGSFLTSNQGTHTYVEPHDKQAGQLGGDMTPFTCPQVHSSLLTRLKIRQVELSLLTMSTRPPQIVPIHKESLPQKRYDMDNLFKRVAQVARRRA